jgi:hypothetical protein
MTGPWDAGGEAASVAAVVTAARMSSRSPGRGEVAGGLGELAAAAGQTDLLPAGLAGEQVGFEAAACPRPHGGQVGRGELTGVVAHRGTPGGLAGWRWPARLRASVLRPRCTPGRDGPARGAGDGGDLGGGEPAQVHQGDRDPLAGGQGSAAAMASRRHLPPEYVLTGRPPRPGRTPRAAHRPASWRATADDRAGGDHDEVLRAGRVLVDRGELAGQARPARTARTWPATSPQHPGRAGVRLEQHGQYPDRGGLGGCVGILHERLVPAGNGIMTVVALVRSR